MDKPEVTTKKISSPDFSRDFCNVSASMGMDTIKDIIQTPPGTLVKHSAFSYRWLAELVEYLGKKGSLHLLQPIMGSTTD
jgi:hypothetical protein